MDLIDSHKVTWCRVYAVRFHYILLTAWLEVCLTVCLSRIVFGNWESAHNIFSLVVLLYMIGLDIIVNSSKNYWQDQAFIIIRIPVLSSMVLTYRIVMTISMLLVFTLTNPEKYNEAYAKAQVLVNHMANTGIASYKLWFDEGIRRQIFL
jgi:hypothetical protein